MNVPGDNVGTDVISSWEGASDDKRDEPPVLLSNPPPNGKILVYQKYLESKRQQEGEKKKKKRKRKEKKKRKRKIKEKSWQTNSYCKEQDWKFAI